MKTHAGHPFAKTTALDEVFLQPAQLLIEQVVGLMDEASSNVRNYFRRTSLYKFTAVVEGLRRLPAKTANVLRFF